MRPATPPAGTTTEEALLLRRVADGDHREPLVDLYNRYASRHYGLGLRLMGDAGMAEELTGCGLCGPSSRSGASLTDRAGTHAGFGASLGVDERSRP
jgi:hypothetical protein